MDFATEPSGRVKSIYKQVRNCQTNFSTNKGQHVGPILHKLYRVQKWLLITVKKKRETLGNLTKFTTLSDFWRMPIFKCVVKPNLVGSSRIIMGSNRHISGLFLTFLP